MASVSLAVFHTLLSVPYSMFTPSTLPLSLPQAEANRRKQKQQAGEVAERKKGLGFHERKGKGERNRSECPAAAGSSAYGQTEKSLDTKPLHTLARIATRLACHAGLLAL